MQPNIAHIWTRFNKSWAISGVLSGLGAGLAMILAASLLGQMAGEELFFAPKLIGAALLGGKALAVDSSAGIWAGLTIHFTLSAFFGLVFAQTIRETARKRILLALGLMGGMAVWLFWCMMFMPSFNQPMLFLLPKLTALALHLLFGLVFSLLLITLRATIISTDSAVT
ncbi:MAG: hypothetical protein Q7S68_05030 [Deltaproteobacteria bacterium]|nr:hypothetical protein [Deltaproteobacteria bacterium]